MGLYSCQEPEAAAGSHPSAPWPPSRVPSVPGRRGRPELSMEAGQDYYYEQGYGSRRRLIPPMYDEYGEILEEDYYYSPQIRGRGRGMRGRGGPKRVGFRDLPPEEEIEQAEPIEEAEPSKAAKKLKSVMKLSKFLAASKGGDQPSGAGGSPWKRAKMLKMFGGKKKDDDYAKLMSARRIDSLDSLTDGPALTGPIDSKVETRSKLGKVFKKINLGAKLQGRSMSAEEEGSQAASEDDKKSKVSISVTESEAEASGSGEERERGTDEESSGDKDYLKVDLDKDLDRESTVDSDEEAEESGEEKSEEEEGSEKESEKETEDEEDEEEPSGGTEESGSSARSSVRSSATQASKGSGAGSGSGSRSGSESASETVSESAGESRRSSQRTQKSSEDLSEPESGTGTASDSEAGSGSEEAPSHRSSQQSGSEASGGSSGKSQMSDQSSVASEESSGGSRSASGSQRSRKSTVTPSEATITEESEEEEEEEEAVEESKESSSEQSDASSSRRSSVSSEEAGPSAPVKSPSYPTEIKSMSATSDETYGGLSPITEVDEDAISSDSSESGRRKRIKLVVDGDTGTSSTGEESTTETPQSSLPKPNSHGNINGSIYLAQNGTIVRTRRTPLPNNLKSGSPCRLAEHFKKLDKLGITLEEPPSPVSSTDGTLNGTENGTSVPVFANVDVNLNTCPSAGSLGSGIVVLKTFGPRTNVSKAVIDRNNSRISLEQETCVDNHKDSRSTPESQSEHTDEGELWMGPWNNLHIPMTKL
uniref:Uncharacterized protein n=1 Tax=Knipowitschia caucasica TaxID=637954 RepID=A0AAV2JLP1_KNICA